jgi:hypothetical protein
MTCADELWTLAWGHSPVDPERLAVAVEKQLGTGRSDFRTRLLIRDSVAALRSAWGATRFAEWQGDLRHARVIDSILAEDLGPPGFDFQQDRLMDAVRPEIIEQYLRELGTHLRRPARVVIGGAIALIVARKLSRATGDIDVVDEIPPELRAEHDLLDDLARRYRLRLTHFQSHYLPHGWEQRIHSLGRFGELDVALVDTIDLCAGKLFSRREKDFDDLRALLPQIDRDSLTARLRTATHSFRSDPTLLEAATRNWYVLTGDPLPPAESA